MQKKKRKRGANCSAENASFHKRLFFLRIFLEASTFKELSDVKLPFTEEW